MVTAARSDAAVGIRCDAGPALGVGHLMRGLALAEELVERGIPVVFVGHLVEPAWAVGQIEAIGARAVPAPAQHADVLDIVAEEGIGRLVIDSYSESPALAHGVKRSGRPVLVVSDGNSRGQEADVILDQNLGAESNPVYRSAQAHLLLGLDFVLLRDSIRRLRPPRPRSARQAGSKTRVLAFFGGTDAAGAALVVVPLILTTGIPMELTVVARDPQTAARLRDLPVAEGQEVVVISPTPHIAQLALDADLAVSAGGTSTWELLSLGVPTALVWVVDNQVPGYKATTSTGYAAGLGGVREISAFASARAAAVDELAGLLTSASRRSGLSARGWRAVDGQGRQRVADALMALPVT